jgi:transposase
LEEKLAILAAAARPGASVAAVARKHDLNANLIFAWRRLQRRGLLEGQRHAPSPRLLPVKITQPTITPTRRASAATASVSTSAASAATSFIEIVIGESARIRLHGEAQQAVLARVLEWLPRR